MSHIALLCPEMSGHLNPTMALGEQLVSRGHRVSFIGLPDAQQMLSSSNLEFHSVGEAEFPVGALADVSRQLGELSGLAALKYTIDHVKTAASVMLRDVPNVARQIGVDAMVVDQIRGSGGTIADHVGVPFVSVSNALTLHSEAGVPPYAFSWAYREGWWGALRNRAGWAMFDRLAQPVLKVVNARRAEWKLPPLLSPPEAGSKIAQICQQPRGFDFPRRELPNHFHYVGPLTDDRPRPPVEFPFEKLDGRPLVYASMGTLQNRLHQVFGAIVEACEGLPIQLVLSLGSSGSNIREHLPDWPLIVDYAPQLELLKRATLTITHAGLNTTLESLSHGVPMVAIPVTNDQPAVAARIAYTGVGEFISLKRLNAARLRESIVRVLNTDTYRARAQQFKDDIAASPGPPRAAEIIEQAISTGKPVLR